jgi:hypothetical protein
MRSVGVLGAYQTLAGVKSLVGSSVWCTVGLFAAMVHEELNQA